VSEDSTLDSQDDTESIKFDYIKSNFFRVVTVDGGTVSLTAQGKIFLTLYNERLPIPRQLTYKILPDNTLGELVDIISREGYVREVEIGVVIDVSVAEKICDSLSQGIQGIKSNLSN